MTADENSGNTKGEIDQPHEGNDQLRYSSLFDRLGSEHQRIFDLLNRIDPVAGNDIDLALKYFSLLEAELMTHLEGEERFFYTALEAYDEASDVLLQGYEEHLIAKTLLASLKSLALDDNRWKAKIDVLRKLFEIHVQTEEILISKAKTWLDDEKAREIAEQILVFREKGGTTKAVGEPIADL